jgi:hypothetical protein
MLISGGSSEAVAVVFIGESLASWAAAAASHVCYPTLPFPQSDEAAFLMTGNRSTVKIPDVNIIEGLLFWIVGTSRIKAL